ncbi:DUF6660 family protein [Roseivirga misakiensis]|uniref:DUF6660 family protein n=1 Tax=Roseivirga misakiensis TaxID=1563681 RepID=UPI001C9E3679|nr:DUF6660 family protein [Roseivirga misakiensis]
MKITAIILSLLIISLYNQPCVDDLGEINTDEISQEIGSDQHDESTEHNDDDCSSFCACNCCQSQVFSTNVSIPALTSFTILSALEASPNWISAFSTSIWEPPQVG